MHCPPITASDPRVLPSYGPTTMVEVPPLPKLLGHHAPSFLGLRETTNFIPVFLIDGIADLRHNEAYGTARHPEIVPLALSNWGQLLSVAEWPQLTVRVPKASFDSPTCWSWAEHCAGPHGRGSVHADVVHVVTSTLPVQCLQHRVILPDHSPPGQPGLHPGFCNSCLLYNNRANNWSSSGVAKYMMITTVMMP